jgi:hypothetical protein
MKRLLPAFTLAISLVCGTLGAQTPAVQRSARTTMYVGVVPAELAQAEVDLHAKPSEHTTQTPNLRGRHHVVVALFDTRTGRRITDAKVTATLRGPSGAPSLKPLEPMQVGDVMSYGNVFVISELPGHRFEIEVARPGQPPDRFAFSYHVDH